MSLVPTILQTFMHTTDVQESAIDPSFRRNFWMWKHTKPVIISAVPKWAQDWVWKLNDGVLPETLR